MTLTPARHSRNLRNAVSLEDIFLVGLGCQKRHYVVIKIPYISYGHRIMKARLPVRSAIFKHDIARLVLQWVTMRESLVL